MKKDNSKHKRKRHSLTRTRYAYKRKSSRWRKRKKINYAERASRLSHISTQDLKPYTEIIAPPNFSFIENTNEILKYFADAKKIYQKKGNVTYNISGIESLTSDAIALLIGTINDKKFIRKGLSKGSYPINPELNMLFSQSGFEKFVDVTGKKEKSTNNFLHRERHYKVEPTIARKACIMGLTHTFGNEIPYEPLYDILIECMSNTNNHASLGRSDRKTLWWLHVYNDPKSTITAYSFLDLGVGIFESIDLQDSFQNILKNYFKGTILYKHINLVEDLLNGNIQSRIDIDNDIRGKGIPQIVMHSKLQTFKEFYIISNDVKINVKTGFKEQLNYNFKGTFIYWQIQNINNGNKR